MTIDKYIDSNIELAKSTNHIWILNDDGIINMFAYSVDFHNGPICKKCGYSYCEHCDSPEKECEVI
jgi:hypothetical protein